LRTRGRKKMRISKLLGAMVLSLAITGVPAAAVAAEWTEGERFANNYGYGNDSEDQLTGRTPQELSTHRALARLHRYHVLVIENQRTEGEKFANNYGFGTSSETVAAVERTEGEKFANNYGFGTADEIVVDRGQRADAARWQAQADAFQAGRVAAASTPPSAPVDPGLPWTAIALSGSLMVLLGGATMAIVRHQPRSTV
jgi:hypothetical protein